MLDKIFIHQQPLKSFFLGNDISPDPIKQQDSDLSCQRCLTEAVIIMKGSIKRK